MKLQRQHFLLSYFKILSVDLPRVQTRKLPRDSPILNQLSHQCAVCSFIDPKITLCINLVLAIMK